MTNELLLLKKLTDTLIEQTKTKPQKTLEYKMRKQMQTYSIFPTTNLFEAGNCLLAVTSFEAKKSLFNITNENKSFSNTTPGHWNSEDGEKLINRLKKFLQLRPENDIEIHVKEVERSSTRKEIEKSGYNLAGIYEFSDINLLLKSLLPNKVKVEITIDDIRLKSNLTTSETIRFTKKSKKSVFHSSLGFTQSHSGPLGDIERFFQLITGSYGSGKPINFTGKVKIHLKTDCIIGSIVTGGVTEPILHSFALDQPLGYKIF